MSDSPQKRLFSYAIALIATAVVGLVRFALMGAMGDTEPFLIFVLPVIVSAWYGGLRPGLLATVASAVASVYLFVPPHFSLRIVTTPEAIGAVIFCVCGVAISLLYESLHATRRALERQSESLAVEAAERRRAEEALRDHTRALEHSHVLIKDMDDRILRWTPGAERLYGWTRVEAEGRTSHELLKTQLPAPREAILAELREKGEWHGELVQTSRAGERLTVASHWVRHFDVQGRPSLLEVDNDITSRREAEAASRRAREQLEMVTLSMAAPVTRCTRDFRYAWVSKPYAEWLGLSAEQVVGRPIADVIGAEAFARLFGHFERVLSGERVECEEEIRFDGIGPRWIHAVHTPTFGEDDRPDGWVAVVLDVTERRNVEDALRAADRRKDEFLATLAHELRNPLAPIRSAVEVLKMDGPSNAHLAWSRDVIDRQVQHMVRLIDDLLDVSRISRNKLVLRRERIELASVLRNALETSRPLIEARGHRVEARFPEEPIALDGDPIRLAQVFSNLLNNAAKFTPAPGRIRVAAAREDGDVAISVSDDGVGIEPHLQPKLFEMFSQVAPPLERAQDGLGIGLSLVRGLAELHGGRVGVQSDGPGRGSTFTVWLPIASPEPRADREVARRPRGSLSRPRLFLVVDDNRDVAEGLASALRVAGHEVHLAFDGEEAVAAAEKIRPEVVLLDIGMPKLNGYEVAGRIRKQPWGREMVLIAVTGWGQEADRRHAAEAGFDHHVVKPIAVSTIERELEHSLTRT